MEKNELTNTIHTTLCPRAVLIAYTYAQDKKYFLEQRSIDAKGRMGEGHPVTVEFMNELVRNYSETYSGTPYGRLPSNLLYADTRKGSEEYIWYNPPGKRMMYFVENLGIENAQYNLPGIIYQAKETQLDVYAYKDNLPDKRVSRFGKNRETPEPDLCEPARILGKEILADGIHPPGRKREPDKVKPRAGDKGGTGQGFQPRRTETVKQYET